MIIIKQKVINAYKMYEIVSIYHFLFLHVEIKTQYPFLINMYRNETASKNYFAGVTGLTGAFEAGTACFC